MMANFLGGIGLLSESQLFTVFYLRLLPYREFPVKLYSP